MIRFALEESQKTKNKKWKQLMRLTVDDKGAEITRLKEQVAGLSASNQNLRKALSDVRGVIGI